AARADGRAGSVRGAYAGGSHQRRTVHDLSRAGLNWPIDRIEQRRRIIGHQMSDNVVAPLPVRAPLVSQTAAAIRARIEAGRWQSGEQLPSEPQLANELGISRGTLRESVRLLISDGLLDRRHGVGTFVARVPPPTIDRGIDELFGAGDAIAQMGYLPSVGAC